ncbi:Ribosomal large subunit pseudouridine synthase A [compost metagenome]
MDIKIVFENSHIVVVDKAPGVLSTPSRFKDEDGRFCLGTALQDHLGTQIYPVHRLDFEVSGLVMYAKNAEAHRIANSWFEKKEVSKTYRAWTTGQDFSHIPANVTNPRVSTELAPGQSFKWESLLLRGKRRAFESPQGKPSLTLATYLGRSEAYHSWDLHPVTGRAHQLRFDLSRHGFPIVGDKLYGSLEKWGRGESIALRAYLIDLTKSPFVEKLGLPPFFRVSENPIAEL